MPNLQLSKNLLALRKANHLTQDQVSDYLSISRQAYSNYEICNRMPDLDTLMLLSKLYHITLDQLVAPNYKNVASEELTSYNLGINVTTADTIYLTDKEVNLILNYRDLEEDTKTIVDGFVISQTDSNSKKNKGTVK